MKADGDRELRERIVVILGLETSPDGEPDFLLTYDADGTVLEGVDYSEEVDEIVALIQAHTAKAALEARIHTLETGISTFKTCAEYYTNESAQELVSKYLRNLEMSLISTKAKLAALHSRQEKEA